MVEIGGPVWGERHTWRVAANYSLFLYSSCETGEEGGRQRVKHSGSNAQLLGNR